MTKHFLAISLTLSAVWTTGLQTFGQRGLQPGQKSTNSADYRTYSLTHEGNVANGAKLFADEQKLACAKCHSIDGKAGKAGPDLLTAGDNFGRSDLVDAILKPSLVIAPGYGTVIVTTKAGAEHQGVLKQSNDSGMQVMGGDGKLVSVAKADVQQQRSSDISLMPDGVYQGLTLAEFTDLTEYLTSLKQPDSALAANRAMPLDLPEIAQPVGMLQFFGEAIRLPRGRVQTGLTGMYQIPGHTNLFLVTHQQGMIWLIEKNGTNEEKTVFSDLQQSVHYQTGPNGLLGVAFHPKFRENRKYYLQHQLKEEGKVATVVEEKVFTEDFKHDSGQPPRRLIKIPSVAEDHSGGTVAFGPDGFLYFAMGDTGPHNDPNGQAQNMQLLIGKMLRIDVDKTEPGKEYAIPMDNPFRGNTNGLPEIWAWGFRNPWRFSFDSLNGALWLADVGQDRAEEVDIVQRGQNYGWNVYEGFEPFSNTYRKEGAKYTSPFFAYRRKYGNSITGGYVYRGDKTSTFYGAYIFGDYNSKRIFGITQQNGALKDARQIATIPQGLASFGTDEAGNIYAIGYEGLIYKLEFTTSRFDQLKPN